ncbi:MAG TPA: glycoside hydrolase family 43 protein [Polyangiaceae bacterium]|nr:glycoside hydrolase family 43 protein [Polyangiaceae bacterium]
MFRRRSLLIGIAFSASLSTACHHGGPAGTAHGSTSLEAAPTEASSCVKDGLPLRAPLVTNIYTADPSAHVFGGTLYVYPSHDLLNNPPANNSGDHYGMKDYHVLSFERGACSKFVDHGEALNVKDVPWASQQMWAPDAAFRNGTYFLYFPARDKAGVFRIGVAKSASPVGPFTPEAQPIPGSYSIDPAVFVDDDDQAYLYFGGIWGGQLQNFRTGGFDAHGTLPGSGENALGPRFAKLSADMLSFEGQVRELSILDREQKPLVQGDNERRFFEGVWMHKYNGVYYLSYSTGDTHYLVYATGKTPSGPFTYQGRLLTPVSGWTTHHSIVQYDGKWYLFYHDDSLSGADNQRSVKVMELSRNADGSLPTMTP